MNNTVHLIDNMEFMKTIPDKFYDLAIVDPPYGIGFDGEDVAMSAGMRKDGTQKKNKTWNNPKPKGYIKKQWDSKKPDKKYFDELFRISKNQIIWGGNYFSDVLKPHGGWIVWEKGVPEGMSLSQAELAYNTISNSIQIIKILWAGYKKVENESRIHPTQKPIALYKWLLSRYVKPGWTIFDSHVGSGSIRIACHDMGFDFTGCENDADYWQAQEERYKNHIAQLELFENDEIQQGIFTQPEIGD
jgi:site-specific DNA-methyltransferase (adenine-specific)